MPWKTKTVDDAYLFTTQAAIAVAGNSGDGVYLWEGVAGITFSLDVTVDESSAADFLDVYVQTMLDGTNWTDVVHFPQHAGDDGAERYIERMSMGEGLAFPGFAASAALSAGVVRNLIGDKWRVRWEVVNDSTSAAFTFTVHGCPM